MIRICCGLAAALLMGFWTPAARAADASRCAQIADSQARLICYDAVYPPKAAMAAPAMPPPTPVAAAPAVAKGGVSTLFGLLPKKDKPKKADTSLHAVVTQVQMRAAGQLITLDNGQVWQLTEYQRDAFVKADEGVVIDPASLGSFLMSAERGGLSVRVKRVR